MPCCAPKGTYIDVAHTPRTLRGTRAHVCTQGTIPADKCNGHVMMPIVYGNTSGGRPARAYIARKSAGAHRGAICIHCSIPAWRNSRVHFWAQLACTALHAHGRYWIRNLANGVQDLSDFLHIIGWRETSSTGGPLKPNITSRDKRMEHGICAERERIKW